MVNGKMGVVWSWWSRCRQFPSHSLVESLMQEREIGVCFGVHRLYLGGEVATSNPILCTSLCSWNLNVSSCWVCGVCWLVTLATIAWCYCIIPLTLRSVKFKQAVHTVREPPTQNDLESVASYMGEREGWRVDGLCSSLLFFQHTQRHTYCRISK